MLFSSSLFLTIFLPFTILGYWISGKAFKNIFLLLVSVLFYAWGEPLFVFVLLGISFVNYYLARYLSGNRKLLTIYIILNVGMLVICKYLPAMFHQLHVWISDEPQHTPFTWNYHLPLGVSFYVFHAISFGVLSYRNTIRVKPSPGQFLLYIFLFPHQIAGPIVPYNQIEKELPERTFQWDHVATGMKRFTVGLAKKAILSNGFSYIVTLCTTQQAFSDDSTLAWINTLAYTFHIYFDFSGYSDMAIGLASIFGFHFPENFNKPYISKSITEFWQRWHISLGSFMREYLYIPLGGNRKGSARTLLNLWIVFLISGIWHGANWTFVAWGCFHGFFIILDRIFWKPISDRLGIIAIILTFLIAAHGWVFFQASSIGVAFEQLQRMWTFNFSNFTTTGQDRYILLFLLLGFGIVTVEYLLEKRPVFNRKMATFTKHPLLGSITYVSLYFLSYSFLISGNENPFIYFNF